jgi:hypothetical protein
MSVRDPSLTASTLYPPPPVLEEQDPNNLPSVEEEEEQPQEDEWYWCPHCSQPLTLLVLSCRGKKNWNGSLI